MRRAVLLLALLPITTGAQAAATNLPPGYHLPESADERAWREQDLQLPPYPKEEALLKFHVSGISAFDFFIDLATVSVGTDGVIRYTLLAKSDSGAKNVTFEGIKCNGREKKIYAVGRSDGTWSQPRNPEWSPISGLQANRQHAVLADDYFCPGRMIVRNTGEALNALRRGGHPRAASDASLWNQPR